MVSADPGKEDVELTGETGYYQFVVYEGVTETIVAQLMRKADQICPSVIEDLQQEEKYRMKMSSVQVSLISINTQQ